MREAFAAVRGAAGEGQPMRDHTAFAGEIE